MGCCEEVQRVLLASSRFEGDGAGDEAFGVAGEDAGDGDVVEFCGFEEECAGEVSSGSCLSLSPSLSSLSSSSDPVLTRLPPLSLP